MDPDATLARIREIVGAYQDRAFADVEVASAAAAELVELVEALDSWIVNGGHLPIGWKRVIAPPLPADLLYGGL